MKKYNPILGASQDSSVKKYYILTQPTRLSDLDLDEMESDDTAADWREKSRQMQMRRWRKIRHQLA